MRGKEGTEARCGHILERKQFDEETFSAELLLERPSTLCE